jgi:hypothetical protein
MSNIVASRQLRAAPSTTRTFSEALQHRRRSTEVDDSNAIRRVGHKHDRMPHIYTTVSDHFGGYLVPLPSRRAWPVNTDIKLNLASIDETWH